MKFDALVDKLILENTDDLKSKLDWFETFIKRERVRPSGMVSERMYANDARKIAKLFIENNIDVEKFFSENNHYDEYMISLIEREMKKISEKSELDSSLKSVDSWWSMFEPLLKTLEETLRENLTKAMRKIQTEVGSENLRYYIDQTGKQNEEIEKLKIEYQNAPRHGQEGFDRDRNMVLRAKIDILQSDKMKYHPFSWLMQYTTNMGEPEFSSIIEKVINDTIEANKNKLKKSIAKAIKDENVTDVEEKSIRIGDLGFEGDFELTFDNGSKRTLRTQAIGAGGYNIQSFHYRYLCKFVK
jgi:hypothetical protein